jgi:GT2 family glycosyltransferase
VPDSRVVIVNNGSSDGTVEFLDGRPDLKVIHHPENRGVGFAFNQGIEATAADWVVLLNNDVLVTAGWLDGLLGFARETGCDLVGPAMCEGELDYDLAAHSQAMVKRLAGARRNGIGNAVCLTIRRRLFQAVGLFDDDPGVGIYVDDEFCRRARRAGFRLAITGRAFLHHFGSITQKSIKADSPKARAILGDRAYYRKKYKLTWLWRHYERRREQAVTNYWRLSERARYGCTLLSSRHDGRFAWR